VESDIRTFLQGFNVQSLLVPLAPDNTKRAGKARGREEVREGGKEYGKEGGVKKGFEAAL